MYVSEVPRIPSPTAYESLKGPALLLPRLYPDHRSQWEQNYNDIFPREILFTPGLTRRRRVEKATRYTRLSCAGGKKRWRVPNPTSHSHHELVTVKNF